MFILKFYIPFSHTSSVSPGSIVNSLFVGINFLLAQSVMVDETYYFTTV